MSRISSKIEAWQNRLSFCVYSTSLSLDFLLRVIDQTPFVKIRDLGKLSVTVSLNVHGTLDCNNQDDMMRFGHIFVHALAITTPLGSDFDDMDSSPLDSLSTMSGEHISIKSCREMSSTLKSVKLSALAPTALADVIVPHIKHVAGSGEMREHFSAGVSCESRDSWCENGVARVGGIRDVTFDSSVDAAYVPTAPTEASGTSGIMTKQQTMSLLSSLESNVDIQVRQNGEICVTRILLFT